MTAPLLHIENLSVRLGGQPVLEDVSLTLARGEMLGLVGESGSGKSVTALTLMRLVAGEITSGRILFDGRDVLKLDAAALRHFRGGDAGMIFQEPMTSLNPVFTIGDQIAEAIRLHRDVDAATARTRVVELLDLVGFPAPSHQLGRYPHQLSGGQRQRVMIAIALANEPGLLIADEPTTALDVTIQAQILDLLQRLRQRLGMAVLFITHDLGVVAEYCDRVAVMYAGRIVEEGPSRELLAAPRHRYTEALLRTIPASNPPGVPLPSIPGAMPRPGPDRWKLCAFLPRCHAPVEACQRTPPELEGAPHPARCWNPAA